MTYTHYNLNDDKSQYDAIVKISIVTVGRFRVQGFRQKRSGTQDAKRSCTEIQSEFYVALDQQYIPDAEFQDVYDHAGCTRADRL